MGAVLALDIGQKRTGLAVSDENQVFAFPLETIPSHTLLLEIKRLATERVLESLVVGMPRNLKNENTDNTARVERTIKQLNKAFPELKIFTVDERFTSKMAQQAMLIGGMKKKERQVKENTDKLSATLILQSFLEQKEFQKPLFQKKEL